MPTAGAERTSAGPIRLSAACERTTVGSRRIPTSGRMENMNRVLTIAILLFSLHAHATEWHESRDIEELFSSANVNSTFILYDGAAHRYVGHDQIRAETRFVPASTYKAWEMDVGRRDAIAMSHVIIYQDWMGECARSRRRLAGRVGAQGQSRVCLCTEHRHSEGIRRKQTRGAGQSGPQGFGDTLTVPPTLDRAELCCAIFRRTSSGAMPLPTNSVGGGARDDGLYGG